MSTLLDSYLEALSRLKKEMNVNSYNRRHIDLLEVRLIENIDNSLYGNTKENSAERYEILDRLNEITRNLHDVSFYEYCQLSPPYTLPVVNLIQEIEDHAGTTFNNSSDQIAVSEEPSDIVQQTINFIVSVSEYVVILQKNVQSAKGVFSDHANISQEHCEKELSSFTLFDCTNFPDYNRSLHKAKTRLQYLNFQVNKLIDLCDICDDVDRPSRSYKKKIQELVGILDVLSHDVVSVQTDLDRVDAKLLFNDVQK